MAKFKVGDIIIANEKSNNEYVITTQKMGWLGKVVSMGEDGYVSAKTLAPADYYGEEFALEENYFDLDE